MTKILISLLALFYILFIFKTLELTDIAKIFCSGTEMNWWHENKRVTLAEVYFIFLLFISVFYDYLQADVEKCG